MSTLDLTRGYWQLPLALDPRKYTAFLHGSKLYRCKRISFELETAGSSFIRTLGMALGDEVKEFLPSRNFQTLLTMQTAAFETVDR